MRDPTRLVLLRLPDSAAVLAVGMYALAPNIDQPADKVRYLNCQLQLGKMLAEALVERDFDCGMPS